MKSNLLGVMWVFFFNVFTVPSHAELVDNGSGLIYDTILDITWAQPAERTTWDDAKTWAAELTLGGVSGWRLPYISVAAGEGPSGMPVDCKTATEFACRDNEMGYMFYYNLSGTFREPILESGDPDLVLFPTLQSGEYWSGTDNAYEPRTAWNYLFLSGASIGNVGKHGLLNTWVVHDGNVGAVQAPVSELPVDAKYNINLHPEFKTFSWGQTKTEIEDILNISGLPQMGWVNSTY